MSCEISAVVLEGVGHQYSGRRVLTALRGQFGRGLVHVILGPNGSGKTTLLRIVSRLQEPSFGRVRYVGVGSERVSRCIGYCGQESLLYPDLTGEENLMFGAGLYGRGEGAVERVATRLGLGTFRKRSVRAMSRGQRQRLALARSLVHGPSLVVLDEPTSSLDREGVGVLVGAIREEVSGGRVVIVATHEPVVFESLPNKLWALSGGCWGSV